MSTLYNKIELAALNGKTIVITGGDGMLGTAFQDILKKYTENVNLHSFGKLEFDVSDKHHVKKHTNLNPDIIIHCAAIVNADYCEDNIERATDVKINGMKNIIEMAKLCNAKIFYPQSFLVYDGKENPITEKTKPNPLGTYGKLKYDSELLLRQEMENSLVVRMAGFFGGKQKDKNFVGKIIPHMANLMKDGAKELNVGDRIWQPTYTNDLAYNSLLLLANDKNGVYCMSSHGEASFHELTCEIVKILAIPNFNVSKVLANSVTKDEKAKRPGKAIIENKRLQNEGLDRQRTWQESLEEYVNQTYFKNLFK
jgi:dTDP-4-dehydrorhamnose reductase